ncbi:mitochondrial import inner membrane translocase subunit Tim21-like [Rhopilema esculentum]|uniref:mitochondrial import inner membrane translocase subunit Tim21-like n=1 Tax=Rhopilema esculentum TaxID=499914 RepID=UPI0031E262E6
MYACRQSIETRSRLIQYLSTCKRKSLEKIDLLAWKNGLYPATNQNYGLRKSSALCSAVYKKCTSYGNETYNKTIPGVLIEQHIDHTYSYGFSRFSTANTNTLFQLKKGTDSQDVVEAREHKDGQLTVGAKVKQAGKDASYMGIVLVGFAVTGVLIWYVLSELLFSFSPNSVYSKALKVVKQNTSVLHAIGEPVKAYGEETSRGRRRRVSHQEYIVDGVNYMRVKFYIAGSKRKGTVHVDTKEISRGRFEFRYIFVELDGHPPETIIVEDRR